MKDPELYLPIEFRSNNEYTGQVLTLNEGSDLTITGRNIHFLRFVLECNEQSGEPVQHYRSQAVVPLPLWDGSSAQSEAASFGWG
jgi:hypothetical protein